MHGVTAELLLSVAAIIFGIFVFTSPLWLLVSFLVFALGRRKFNLRFLFALITGESICIASSVALWSLLDTSNEMKPAERLALGLQSLFLSLPLWVPIVGLSYAGGRKSYKAAYLLGIVAAEFLAIIFGCGMASYFLEL